MSDTRLLMNSTGQVPSIDGLPGLIDSDTPQAAYTRTGFDGQEYKLVFSDEVSFLGLFLLVVLLTRCFGQFNTPGRTFWPGDDPFWEAVDVSCRAFSRASFLLTWLFFPSVLILAISPLPYSFTTGKQPISRSMTQMLSQRTTEISKSLCKLSFRFLRERDDTLADS